MHYNSNARDYCPYCKADLSLYSRGLLKCPFCNRKIFGVVNDANEHRWSRFNINRLLLVAIPLFLILMIIIILVFLK